MDLGVPRLLPEAIGNFLDARLMVDIQFASAIADQLSPEVRSVIQDVAQTMERRYWSPEAQSAAFGQAVPPSSTQNMAIRQTLVTTAALIAHESTGTTRVTMSEVGRAIDYFSAYAEAHGLASVVAIYGKLVALENNKAVTYYRPMPVADFVRGVFHRPQTSPELLQAELDSSVALGSFVIETVGGVPCLQQTAVGASRAAQYREELAVFSAVRGSALAAVEVSSLDIERFIQEGVPDADPVRHRLTRMAGIREGMRVLDCGSAAGANLFEGGVLEMVGSTGRVAALDPAAAMIARLQQRARKAGYRNVDAVVARAESMPFANDSFDVVIGSAFLRYTDLRLATGEMLRVTRPGGTIATVEAIEPDLRQIGWFRNWFAPAFDAAERMGVPLSGRLPAPGAIARALERNGAEEITMETDGDITMNAVSPESFVFWMRAAGLLTGLVENLPWMAANDLWRELVERGHRVLPQVPPEQRFLRWPVEYVRAKRRTTG